MTDGYHLDGFSLPADLIQEISKLSEQLGESPMNVVIAAVDHFTQLPEERRKAVMVAASRRRRP